MLLGLEQWAGASGMCPIIELGGGHISSAFSQYLERRVPWVGIHICVPQDPGALTHREQGQTEKDLCGTVAAMMSS